MLVMRTIENLTDPVGEFVSAEQSVGLYNLALAVDPFGLDGVKPRTPFWQKAAYDPHSAAALFDLTVMFSEPSSELAAYVPARVVPDENQHFLADLFELFAAPRKKPCRYGAHGSAIHESQPRLIEFGQIESVAGDGLGFGVVFFDRLLDEAKGLSLFREATQSRQSQPYLHQHSSQKPTAQSGLASATLISRSRLLFFFRRGDRGRCSNVSLPANE